MVVLDKESKDASAPGASQTLGAAGPRDDFIEALEILGHVFFLQGRQTEARIVFNGILALEEDNQVALKHLAALALEEGAGGEALLRLEACAFLAKKDAGQADPRLLLMRAKALSLEGKTAEAGENLAEYMRQCKTPKSRVENLAEKG
jgi:predicted Zn-dependent protease